MFTTPDSVINPEAPKQMIGSTFIFEAESLEQYVALNISLHRCSHDLNRVKKYIESDIYYTSGVVRAIQSLR